MHHALGMLRLVRLGSRLVPFRLAATARAMSASPKLWIDTDAGVDDAQGILLALAHHQTELVGISAVHGNAGPKQVASNVARLLTLAGRTDVPVHLGADKALDGSSGSAPQVGGILLARHAHPCRQLTRSVLGSSVVWQGRLWGQA